MHLIDFWNGFVSLIETFNFFAIICSIGVTAISVYKWARNKNSAEAKTLIAANNFNQSLQNELAEIKYLLEQSQKNDPHLWFEEAKNAQASGEFGNATKCVRTNIDNIRHILSQCYLELAQFDTTLIDSEEEYQNLYRARREAELAALLDPENVCAKELANQINDLMSVLGYSDISRPDETTTSELHIEVEFSAPIGDAYQTINSLCNRSNEQNNKGHFLIAERLAHRAYILALEFSAYDSNEMLDASVAYANALYNLGRYSEAFSVIESAHKRCSNTIEETYFGVSPGLNLHVDTLTQLKRADEALELLAQNMPRIVSKYGEASEEVAKFKYYELKMLDELKSYEEIINKGKQVLDSQSMIKPLSSRHDIATGFCHQISGALHCLERYEEAMSYVDRGIKIAQHGLGENHIQVSILKLQKLNILTSMRCYQEAQELSEELLDKFETTYGVNNSNYFVAKLYHLELIAKTGARDIVLSSLQVLNSQMSRFVNQDDIVPLLELSNRIEKEVLEEV